jgi:oligopeptide transport system ATP-binding protein
MTEYIMEVQHLKKYFHHKRETLKAVDDVSFALEKGETFGLVGESGCGKTTCGKTCLGILKKTDGTVLYKGTDVHKMSHKEFFDFTGEVQMIFQDPYSSLDPRMKVYDIIAEGIRIHRLAKDKEDEKARIYGLLDDVGLQHEVAERYVHEFSGGQRQRIGIARALSVEPDFIFCDEPVSALDVSVQAQIINLLKDLKEKKGLTLLFVAHDLAVVQNISDRIGVMYLGGMMEMGTAKQVITEPAHPYTQALISLVPVPDPEIENNRERIYLSGNRPSASEKIKGCRFCSCCPESKEICEREEPSWTEIEPSHFVACHKYERN